MRQSRLERLTPSLVLLVLVCAFSFGAIVQAARANHYHVNCVGHGFVHGDDTNDGSFFARVEDGCGGGTKSCALYNYGGFIASLTAGGGSTCNVWSLNYGSYTECASSAHVAYSGVFDDHTHFAHNWCG